MNRRIVFDRPKCKKFIWCLWLASFCQPVMATDTNAAATSAAATSEAADQIRHQLSEAAQARWPKADVVVQLTLVPERLNLSHCSDFRITPRGTRLYGRIPVSLHCTAPQPWQLFVQAQVDVELPVVTVSAPLPRGHTLQASDLTYALRNLSDLRPHFVSDFNHAVGYLTSRPLSAEAVIYSSALKKPITVPKGQRVAIAGGRRGLRIAAQGEALEAGMRGEQIKVRNVQSGRELYAWVVGPGQVARHWPDPES